MKVSVVFCGRNDNHNGDFARRSRLAQAHNRQLLAAAGVAVEWIYVEWNPLPDAPLFAGELIGVHPDLRVFAVPGAVHAHVCDNPDVGVLQFFAKNVGARRATGDILLITNADTYFSPELAARLMADDVAADTLYIYERLDLDPALLAGAAVTTADLQDPDRAVKRHQIDPPRCYGAAGDLMLLRRDVFERITGFTEVIRFSSIHVDTLFCRQIETSGGRVVVDGVVYHVDHADSFARSNSGARGNHNGVLYRWSRLPLPYTNWPHWGLVTAAEEARAGVTWLTMPADRLRPEPPKSPVVPATFATDAQFQGPFDAALQLLERLRTPTIVYGFGAEARSALALGQLARLNIVGVLDDNARPLPGVPYPVFDWQDVGSQAFEVVLIGSAWWAPKLLPPAVDRWGTGRVLPSLAGRFVDELRLLDDTTSQLMTEYALSLWEALVEPCPRVALFGAGAHTRWLVDELDRRGMRRPVAILDDRPPAPELAGIPVHHAADFDVDSVDAVLVSSDAAAGKLEARGRQLWGTRRPIVNPYARFTRGPFRKGDAQ